MAPSNIRSASTPASEICFYGEMKNAHSALALKNRRVVKILVGVLLFLIAVTIVTVILKN